MKNPTMKAIAKEAGVTLTTVSCILNDKPLKYSPKTREKVLAIAERMKYRPNALIRGMQTGKSGTAGVMIPNDNYFYSQIVTGIHDVLSREETSILFGWNYKYHASDDIELERRIIHQMIDRRVEGFIIRPNSETFGEYYLEEIRERSIPLILVDRELDLIRSDYVGTSDLQGGRMALEYLSSLKHKHLLYIGSNRVSTSKKRERGFYEALNSDPSLKGESIYLESEHFETTLKSHLGKTKNRPTALFCYNDYTAKTVRDSATQMGFSIPSDLSILGFGNEVLSDQIEDISTFDQKPRKIGSTAAKLYLERISGQLSARNRRRMVTPNILEKNTTTALKKTRKYT